MAGIHATVGPPTRAEVRATARAAARLAAVQEDAFEPEGLEFLEMLLEYEIQCARRYKHSVTFVLTDFSGSALDPRALVRQVLRKSDCFIHCGETRGAIIMRETNGWQAVHAIERLRRFYGSLLACTISMATYPNEGREFSQLRLQLEQWRSAESPPATDRCQESPQQTLKHGKT